MTKRLYKMLREKYTPGHVSLYGNDEGISIILTDRNFCVKRLMNHAELENIARSLFDGFCKIGNFSVILNPDEDRRFGDYCGQIIKFRNFFPPLEMEIYLGRDELKEEQRQKYIEFVSKVLEKYRENSKR